MTLELHPLCTLFPRMAGAEFAALCADIKVHGLRTPIVLHDGMILDGGNRYRACVETGARMEFSEFSGSSAVSFVLSANLHRRHMTAGQQAAIVASAQDWATAQPASRPEKAGNVAGLSTVADRAAQSGASDRTQRMADKVAKADPGLAMRVAHGEVSLPAAHASVSEPRPSPAPVPVHQAAPAAAAPHPELDEVPDVLALLEEAQREVERLTGEVKAAEADDLKAEAIKWRRAYEHAKRQADEKQEAAHRYQVELQKAADRLTRIGKLFGERDPSKVPALVETMFRKHERAPA